MEMGYRRVLPIIAIAILLLGSASALAMDLDNDRLKTYKELINGLNPLDKDMDNDNLVDGAEILQYNTYPKEKDTDRDNLLDGNEVHKYNTDPTKPDTDEDGIRDGREVSYQPANPLKKDIFVEVDHIGNSKTLSQAIIPKLVERFSNAPVNNPSNNSGISLHIRLDDTINNSDDVVDSNELESYKERYFDSPEEIYRYVIFAQDVEKNGKDAGVLGEIKGVTLGEDFVVQTTWFGLGADWFNNNEIGHRFMHELGHSIGLSHQVFDGIDSSKYSFSNYHSAMNYNSPSYYMGYSTDLPFNDWHYLEKHGLRPP